MVRNLITSRSRRPLRGERRCGFLFRRLVLVMSLCIGPAALAGGGVGYAVPGGYGLKIYRVSYDLYPFVQVYFRTFDQRMQPLVNLNYMNIGVMVKGKSYDPRKLSAPL